MKKQYRPAPSAHLSQEKAQRYGERIERLYCQNDNIVTPNIVVGDAQETESPLHDYFDWDDATAAHQYRLNEARLVLRSIHVVVKVVEGVEMTTRAFPHVFVRVEPDMADEVHITRTIKKRNGLSGTRSVYVTAERALSDEELRRQLLDEALCQIRSWQRRYKDLTELTEIFDAVLVVQQRLELEREPELVLA